MLSKERFWNPCGKSFIKQVIHHCVTFKCLNSRLYNDPEASKLPLSRVDDKFLFTCTGVAYPGAFYCKSIYSGYILNEKVHCKFSKIHMYLC